VLQSRWLDQVAESVGAVGRAIRLTSARAAPLDRGARAAAAHMTLVNSIDTPTCQKPMIDGHAGLGVKGDRAADGVRDRGVELGVDADQPEDAQPP